jgi:polysaccharide biosynthesis/export protein
LYLASIFLSLLWAQTQASIPVELQTANLPAQRIGRDDLLSVNVYQSPELTRTVRVGPDGTVRLPMLSRFIPADGLFPNQLETRIADALVAEKLLVDPVVTVTLVEYRSRPISVAGAVKKPLVFQATGIVTLLDAITRAEGLTADAAAEILISRAQTLEGGKTATVVRRIPVRGLIDAADPELNLRLFGGEEIRVPEAGKVYLVGNVKRPGAYPVQDASDTTVLKVLALAEGLAPFAAKLAYIYRRDPANMVRNEIPIELQKILARKTPDLPLQPNDILYIPDNKGRRITVGALERMAGFGSATASGVLIWRR